MSTFTEESLVKKLSQLTSSKRSVETLSFWLIHHRKLTRIIVSVWDRELRKAPTNRKLSFLYLANDVIQNSRNKGPELIKEFAQIIVDAFGHVFTETGESYKKELFKIVSIWKKRAVYGKDVLDHLKLAMQDKKTPKKRPHEEIQVGNDHENENSSAKSSRGVQEHSVFIHAIQELEKAASRDAAVLQKIPAEVQDLSLLENITDKYSANKLLMMADDASKLLTDYSGRLAAKINNRKQLSQMLSKFMMHQKEVLAEEEEEFQEQNRKLQRVLGVQKELKLHIKSLP